MRSGSLGHLPFGKVPTPSTFSHWKTNFKTDVFWFRSSEGRNTSTTLRHPSLSQDGSAQILSLDARIATLKNTIQSSNVKNKIHLEEQKARKEDRFFRGRQIAWMIYEYFRLTGTHEPILDSSDLMGATLREDDVQWIDTRWDEIL